MLTPSSDIKSAIVYLHGQFDFMFYYSNAEEFFRKLSKKLQCPVEDVLVRDSEGIQLRKSDYGEYSFPRLSAPIHVFNAPIFQRHYRARENEAFFENFEMPIIVNGALLHFQFDNQNELLELLKEQLKLGDRREVALSRPSGKPYKLWDTSKQRDPHRFLKHPHLFAFKKQA